MTCGVIGFRVYVPHPNGLKADLHMLIEMCILCERREIAALDPSKGCLETVRG